MHLKQVLIALIILIVLGLGFGYWASFSKPIGAPAEQEQHVLAGTATSTGGYEYTESGQYYDIGVLYPKAATSKAQVTMETALKTEIDDFKQNTEGLDASVLPSLADSKLALSIDYKTYTSAGSSLGSLTSYDFTVFANTGGAHPNTYFKTFTFDQQGNELAITDVLASNPNGLQELSLLVSNDVVAQYKERAEVEDTAGLLYDEGLAPKAENFSNFVIDGDTLVILIPPYQVAAYAVGSFEVRIKLSDIQ